LRALESVALLGYRLSAEGQADAERPVLSSTILIGLSPPAQSCCPP
jgi:hypothetical protein